MIRKRKTVVAKRITPKVMTGIPKLFGILNDPLGNQVESRLMEKEESEQRRTDRFWGQDKDFKDREYERSLMLAEDAASLTNEKWYETVELHKRWDEEYQRNLWFENRSQAKYKEIERREYLKFINSSLSSEEVIGFVWAGNKKRASGSSSSVSLPGESAQHGGLVFSDLSAIGKEVSLSLPSAVGALHMSVHLDGLQQSKAIIDGASVAFKKTLRRINTQSADDGDAAQPFKTNSLAAEIIRTTKKQQQQASQRKPGEAATGGGGGDGAAGTTAAGIVDDSALEVAKVLHSPAVEGHSLHKWDQELMLHLAFMVLDKGGKGFLTPEEVVAVSFDSKAHALLSFTVFWATIKKRNWAFFQRMSSPSVVGAGAPALAHPSQSHSHSQISYTGGHITPLPLSSASVASNAMGNHQNAVAGSGSASITMKEWLAAAQSLSMETCVPVRHIRTQDEHVKISTGGTSTVATGYVNYSRGVGAANVFSGLPEREHRLARSLSEGDCVWALHNGGVLWLPAVVKAIHHIQPSNTSSSHDNTVAYSTYSYDLWYPISQKELNKARATMASRQLLALPSQQQQQQLMQDRLQSLSLSMGSSVAMQAQGASKCLLPKPLDDERRVCAYAFDLVDSAGEGVVALQRLVQCLQSMEFSRVVATSLALSTIFHGGSYASSSGVAISRSQQQKSQEEEAPIDAVGVNAASADSGSKKADKGKGKAQLVSVAGTADIPSLLPVFVDTFSAPAPNVEPQQQPEDEEGKEREARPASSPSPQASQTQQHQAPDWISKLDFLEFCQAVVDIKRYSVVC